MSYWCVHYKPENEKKVQQLTITARLFEVYFMIVIKNGKTAG